MRTVIRNMNERIWERIKLEPIMKDDGSQRDYWKDAEGNEYFRYEDRTGYVIRDASKQDTEEWFVELENSLHKYDKFPLYMRGVAKADFGKNVEEGLDEDINKRVMLIYNPAQELIGIMKLTEEDAAVAKIELSVKSQWIIDAKRDKVMAVIKRMWQNTLLYDRMYISNIDGDNKIFLDSDSIAS